MSGLCPFTALGPEKTPKNKQTVLTPTPLAQYKYTHKVCMKAFDPPHTNGLRIIPSRSIYPALFLIFRIFLNFSGSKQSKTKR